MDKYVSQHVISACRNWRKGIMTLYFRGQKTTLIDVGKQFSELVSTAGKLYNILVAVKKMLIPIHRI